jgi:Ca2+-binding EF-hand superfamily protein
VRFDLVTVVKSQIMDKTKRQPNIAKFVSVYEFPNPHTKTNVCIVHVLQLWEGGSLLEKVMSLIAEGVWNESYAAQAFSQLLFAVKAMHEADGTGAFVHCDIKLDNDFVENETRDAMAICGDFGEVRWLPKAEGNPKYEFQLPRFVGTATYAAPEQLIADASGNHTYSPAGDMWSMGVTLYCILNSSFPFPRDHGADLIRRVRAGRHYAFAKGLSADARDLITQLLSVDASKRPTAREALEHPWIKRATTGDLAAIRDMMNLATSAAGGAITPAAASSASASSVEAARSLVSGVTAAASGVDSGSGKAKDMAKAMSGGLSAEQFRLVVLKLEEVLGKGFDMESAELTESQFETVMVKLDIQGLVIPKLYAVLDVDKSGSLSVKELTSGLAAITQPSEDRARMVFSMYDKDGDGSVSIAELADVLKSCVTDDVRLETIKAQRLVAMLAEIDVEKSGKVTLEQFIEAVRRDPFLAKLMLQPNLHFQRFVETETAAAAETGPWDVSSLRAAVDEAAADASA